MATKLKRFLIEREIAGVGAMSIVELCGASRASNQAIAEIGPTIQWQHSYVADDKVFCIYLAEFRGLNPQACGNGWLACKQDHRGPADHRSAHRQQLTFQDARPSEFVDAICQRAPEQSLPRAPISGRYDIGN